MDDDGEVIFEIKRIGAVQRVAAIHVATGIEVVVQAPAGAALADVQALALRKLKRMQKRTESGESDAATPPRRGKMV
jgi:hypothetical protein